MAMRRTPAEGARPDRPRDPVAPVPTPQPAESGTPPGPHSTTEPTQPVEPHSGDPPPVETQSGRGA